MSEFYSSIVKYYEEIFVPSKAQIEFLYESAKGDRVLDIACGTGKVAENLNNKGKQVLGIDLEPEMVNIAKNKNNIDAKVLNMLDLSKLSGSFDLVYCIGNSIPHLSGLEEVEDFVSQVKNKINNGYLVLQWINFAPFLKQNDEYLGSLPDIKTDRLVFERRYFREGSNIRFNTLLFVDGKRLENNEMLFPLLLDDMIKILENNGFKDIEVFGGFNKTPFNIETSIPVVVRAKYESDRA